ncbi:MAG: hypothetical protein Fur002_17550 [Anaerolineales bacterium]
MTQKNKILFLAAAAVVLFLGFYRNQWNIVLPGKFKNFQYSDQSLVMGRLAETQQRGIFSNGGLLGLGDADVYGKGDEGGGDNQALYDHQYEAYFKNLPFEQFEAYGSQTGMQAMFFGALDTLSPLTPVENMRVYRIIAALSFALLLTYLLSWFLNEFGWGAALLLFAGSVVTPAFTLFGRNLFYVTAFLFLPLAAHTYYLSRRAANAPPREILLVAFFSVLAKILFNGFDFILPSILMLGVPYVYYALRDQWTLRKFTQAVLFIFMGTAAAVLLSLLILWAQLWVYNQDPAQAAQYIINTFNRRTLGNPEQYPAYALSLQANVWDVLKMYFERGGVIAQTRIRFMDVFAVYGALTAIYIAARALKKDARDSARANALLIATWVSMLSPLVWFIIFKGQAFMHPHTNFLSWYMPFMIYGYAMRGYILQNLLFRNSSLS